MTLRGARLERGTELGGYRIEEQIGAGGMGIVYRVTNVALNRIYALKVLAPELAEDEQFRGRFQREMRIAASLDHPNVVRIHYAGEQDGFLFLAMDYIHGEDLRRLILRDGALDPGRAVELLSQIASALDAAHSKGLVHRDIKPGNVLLTIRDGEERAYLTDFGLAKRSDTLAELTVTGSVVGTADYMSPEQVTGDPTDARSDIYSLGCVFFQMLTGKVPYEREKTLATMFAHVHDPLPPLESPLADTYPEFTPVLERAMAKRPDDRYLSAGDLARDATAALRGFRYSGPPSMVAAGEARPGEPRRARIRIGSRDSGVGLVAAGGRSINAGAGGSHPGLGRHTGRRRHPAALRPCPRRGRLTEAALLVGGTGGGRHRCRRPRRRLVDVRRIEHRAAAAVRSGTSPRSR